VDPMATNWAALEAHIDSIMDRSRTPGLAVAVARDGKVEFAQGFGYRDIESRLPPTMETVFPVASVTKSFTALAIMQLQDGGRLSVADPVVKYLPEFRTPDPASTLRITVHHFLTHTSGLPPLPSRWFAFARDVARDLDPGDIPVQLNSHAPIDTYNQLMEFIADTQWTLLGPPGKFMSYSNEGYALLGAIIERVSGLPYPQYVRRHILTPLGLRHTLFDVEMPGEGMELTGLYVSKELEGGEKIIRAPRWWSSNVWLAAGGLCSTTGDLIRYLDVYRTGANGGGDRIVSQAAVKEMMRPHIQWLPRSAYGYGFEIMLDYHGESIVTHDGGRLGASAHVLLAPQHRVSAAALANIQGTPAWTAAYGALHLMLNLPVNWRPVPFPPHPLPKARMKAYAGEYRAKDGREISAYVKAEGLVLGIGGNQYLARPIGDDVFAISEPDSEVYVRFLVDQRGRAWGVAHSLAILSRAKETLPRGLSLARSVVRRVSRKLRSITHRSAARDAHSRPSRRPAR
jgi:CubicO group peptidase (beta-lactamase class C family)